MKAISQNTFQQSFRLLMYMLVLFNCQPKANAQANEEELQQTTQVVVMVIADYNGVTEYGAGIIVGRQNNKYKSIRKAPV